eukprot:scaffold7174_cov55-Attheya_sp.AAC.8
MIIFVREGSAELAQLDYALLDKACMLEASFPYPIHDPKLKAEGSRGGGSRKLKAATRHRLPELALHSLSSHSNSDPALLINRLAY